MRYTVPALALCLVWPAAGAAQEAGAQAAGPGDTADEKQATRVASSAIIVTAGLPDTPGAEAYSTVSIAREAILAEPSGRIDTALGIIAGFQQFRRSDSRSSNPSAQGVTLRALGGNASSRALVLLDGVPQTDPFFGYVPLPALVPETLSSIRVTRGGGSGPFGAGALAGTIALESALPGTVPSFGVSALINDRAETEASLVASRGWGGGASPHGGVTAYARYDRGEGFQTAPEDQRVPASVPAAFESWSVGARAEQSVGSTRLRLAARAFDDRRTLRFSRADSASRGQDLSLRATGGEAWAFDALAYVQRRDFRNVVISSTSFNPVLDQRETPSTGYGAKFELRPPMAGDTVLRLGGDLRVADGSIAEDLLNGFTGALRGQRFAGGRTSTLGAFAELDKPLGALLLTGGVRIDRFAISDGFRRELDASGAVTDAERFADRSGWQASWRAGGAYDLTDDFTLRGAAYCGFRLPTLNELYRPFVIFPVVTQANADLENERLTGVELGADWAPARGLRMGITLFDNRLEGAIANVTIGPNLRQRRNLEAIEARGVEADLEWRRGAFDVTASLAYTDARIDAPATALDEARPPQSPQFVASAALGWTDRSGARAALTLRHTGEQFEDDAGQDRLAPATVIGLFGSLPMAQDFALVGRVENLFDETVVTRNAGGSIDLGTPRTVWIGLRVGY